MKPFQHPPAVSVVLPTHDRLPLFKRALHSVLGQSYGDFEVIVVENACSDGTAEFLDGLRDPRIQRIRLDRFCGASAARNVALREARAEMIAFQDDDDIWLPDKLEAQLQQLKTAGPRVGLCLCGYVMLEPRGPRDRYSDEHFEELDFSLGLGSRGMGIVATPGWLVKKEPLDAAGHFDELLPARNDWELALRLSDLCDFTYVNRPLFIQDQTHLSTMRLNEAAYGQALKRIVEVHGRRWAADKGVTARHAEIIGRAEVTQGDCIEGRRWLRQSLSVYPLQPRVWALLLLSLGGPGVVRRLRQLKWQLAGRPR